MIYEIINPSDSYTCIAEEPKIAMAAIILLGNGKMGLEDESGKSYETIFMFMNEEQTEAKLKELFGEKCLGGFIKDNRPAIADCLDSVMSFGIKSRRLFDEAMKRISTEKSRKEFRESLHDKNRTSLNDFGSYAWRLAKDFRDAALAEA